MSLVLGVGQESQRLWRFLNGAWHAPTLSAASPAVTHPAVSKIPTFYCSVSCGKSSTATLPHKKPHIILQGKSSTATLLHKKPHIICKGNAAPPHCCVLPRHICLQCYHTGNRRQLRAFKIEHRAAIVAFAHTHGRICPQRCSSCTARM